MTPPNRFCATKTATARCFKNTTCCVPKEMTRRLMFFSPTAESFGVSAQIGSGVVRGDPELRFHQGSPPGFHQGRVPPGFHQGSTRVPPGFHQVLQGRGGLGWFEVRFHKGSTRVPPISSRAAGLRKVHEGSARVPPGFQAAGWSGWFEVRFHEGSTRAAGWSGVV